MIKGKMRMEWERGLRVRETGNRNGEKEKTGRKKEDGEIASEEDGQRHRLKKGQRKRMETGKRRREVTESTNERVTERLRRSYGGKGAEKREKMSM